MSDTESADTEPASTEPAGIQPADTEPVRRPAVRGRWGILALTALAVIALDQLSKWWADRTLAPPPKGEGRIIEVIGSAGFRYAENTGMAFSKGADSGRWIALLVIAITAVMVFAASRATTKVQLVLIGLVIGGALGNLIDRVARAGSGLFSGAVVDWVYLRWWPTFNVADAAVVCGGLLLVIFGLREPKEADGSPAPAEPPSADSGQASRGSV